MSEQKQEEQHPQRFYFDSWVQGELRDLKMDIRDLRQMLGSVEQKLEQKIDNLEQKLEQKIDNLQEKSETQTRWLAGLFVSITIATISIVISNLLF